MRKFFLRLLAVLVVTGGLGFIAFAYIGDLTPERTDARIGVTLQTD